MPWDDDMDVSMSWEHNDAFVETLNKTMVVPLKSKENNYCNFNFFKFFVAHVRHVAALSSVALPLQDLLQDLLFRLRALQEFSLLGHISAQHFR